MNRRLISNLITSLMVACSLVVTGVVVRREFFPPAAGRQPNLKPRPVNNWAELISAGEWMGPRNAPVRIVEFSDFQCPFCARTQPVIEAVRRRHPDQVAVVYRHFPLDAIHPYARPAAVAAECAAQQGSFEAFTNLVFAQQDSIGSKPWARFAAEAGVSDAAAFDRCVAAATPAPAVDRDAKLGTATHVEVTPTLVINGTLRPGGVTEAELEALVRSAGAR